MKLTTEYTTTIGAVISTGQGKFSLALPDRGEYGHFFYNPNDIDFSVELGDLIVLSCRRNPDVEYPQMEKFFRIPR